MTIEAKLNFHGWNVNGWYNIGDHDLPGVKVTNMEGDGVGFEMLTRAGNSTISGGFADQDYHGIEQAVWQRTFSTNNEFPTFEAKLFGFPPGEVVELDFFGSGFNANRPRILEVDGVDYINETSEGLPPDGPPFPPTAVNTVADANGEVFLTFKKAETQTAALYAGIRVRWALTPTVKSFPEDSISNGDVVDVKVDFSGGEQVQSVVLSDGINQAEQTLGLQTYDSESDTTTVPVTINQGTLPFKNYRTATVVLVNGSTFDFLVDIVSQNNTVWLLDPVTTEGSIGALVETGTLETGMQLESTVFTFNQDGTPFDPEPGDFNVRIWQNYQDGWTDWYTVNFFESSGVESNDNIEPPLKNETIFWLDVDGNYSASQNHIQLTQGSYSETIPVESSVYNSGDNTTTISFTMDIKGGGYGIQTQLVVVADSVDIETFTYPSITPTEGNAYVTLATVNSTSALLTQGLDGSSQSPVDGDQIEFTDGYNVTIDPTSIVSVHNVRPFDFRIWKSADNVWSNWSTISLQPDPNHITNVELNASLTIDVYPTGENQWSTTQ